MTLKTLIALTAGAALFASTHAAAKSCQQCTIRAERIVVSSEECSTHEITVVNAEAGETEVILVEECTSAADAE